MILELMSNPKCECEIPGKSAAKNGFFYFFYEYISVFRKILSSSWLNL